MSAISVFGKLAAAAAVGGTKFFVAVILSVMSLGYFIPTAIAIFRSHRIGAVFVLNLLTGWTIIGWIVALIWALEQKVQAVYVVSGGVQNAQ